MLMERESRALSGFRVITGGLNEALRHADRSDDPVATQALLRGLYGRGLYGVVFAGIEVYLTTLGKDLAVDWIIRERSSGSRSLSRYNDLVCGLGARRSRVAKIATSRSSAEIFELVHADFTAVTLNRPVAVDQIIGFHGVTALERQNLWGRVAQRSSLGGAREAQEGLELAVERRNSIAHTGDLGAWGNARPMKSSTVQKASVLVESVVLEVEASLTSPPLWAKGDCGDER